MERPTDIFFWVTHLFGIGHLRRAITLTRAFQRAGLQVQLVSGGRPLAGDDLETQLEGATFHQLPSLHAADESFKQLLQADGRPLDEQTRTARRDRLLSLFKASRARVVLTEMFPLGRKQLRFELNPLLKAAQEQEAPPLILASVRDLLVQKPADKTRWMADTVRDSYDHLLIHGDPDFIPLSASFAQHDEIAEQLIYTGYVLNESQPSGQLPSAQSSLPSSPGDARDDSKDEVLVSAGGGAFGYHLLSSALKARPLSRFKSHPWRILAGTNRPDDELAALQKAAPAGVTVERHRTDFPDLLTRCRLSLSQGGYNTVVESLAARAPSLIVPYTAGAQSEQQERARLLAARGALSILDDQDLTPSRLAQALDALPTRQELKFQPLKTQGAEESAKIVKDLLCATRNPST
ncbi:glycosyltransferase family protein [Rhodovibrionaceae bacterium A322]